MPRDKTRRRLDLEALLAPMSVAQFFARYWERRPLILQRRSPSRYEGLPQIDDFETLVGSLTSAQSGWFSVVRTRARPPSNEMLTKDGLLNLSEVVGAYRDGHSLLLNQVQLRHRATALLCRALERSLADAGVALAKNIGANAYLSPPHSQGFRIHYDPHDVFILQLSGHKSWRLYRQYMPFPTKAPSDPISPEEAGPPTVELVVRPGDLLYIPRGVLHEANTSDSASLHLTLSAEVATWRDLIVSLVTQDSRFGQALPRTFAYRASASAGHRRRLHELVTSLATSPLLDETRATIASRLLEHVDPLPSGALRRVDDASSVDARTWVGLAEGTFARVHATNGSVSLQLPGATFRAGLHMRRAFHYLASKQRFRARDLPVAVSENEKLEFVRELYAGGHLVRVSTP